MRRYFRVYQLLVLNSIQTILVTRLGVLIFIFGKLLRFGLYLLFVYFLFRGVQSVVGYTRFQTLLFLLTFTFLGAMGQMLFREVYRFRGTVVSGDFDFDLIRPIHPLVRNLFGGFDILDLITLPVFVTVLAYVISQLQYGFWQLVLYIFLCVNGLLIMGAFHILVAGLTIIYQEIENATLVYRDLETMGRFPVDIYRTPLKEILTFILPIGIIFTVPAKALLGLLSWPVIVISVIVGFLSIKLSLMFWEFAVKRYSSASS